MDMSTASTSQGDLQPNDFDSWVVHESWMDDSALTDGDDGAIAFCMNDIRTAFEAGYKLAKERAGQIT